MKYSLPTLQAVNVTNDLEKRLDTLSDEELENLMNKILENYNHRLVKMGSKALLVSLACPPENLKNGIEEYW